MNKGSNHIFSFISKPLVAASHLTQAAKFIRVCLFNGYEENHHDRHLISQS